MVPKRRDVKRPERTEVTEVKVTRSTDFKVVSIDLGLYQFLTFPGRKGYREQNSYLFRQYRLQRNVESPALAHSMRLSLEINEDL